MGGHQGGAEDGGREVGESSGSRSSATGSLAGSRQRIYSVVRRIPRGRVATYGQVARLANLPGHARLVGYALAALDDRSRIPWHRVVGAGGKIKLRAASGLEQRLRLADGQGAWTRVGAQEEPAEEPEAEPRRRSRQPPQARLEDLYAAEAELPRHARLQKLRSRRACPLYRLDAVLSGLGAEGRIPPHP